MRLSRGRVYRGRNDTSANGCVSVWLIVWHFLLFPHYCDTCEFWKNQLGWNFAQSEELITKCRCSLKKKKSTTKYYSLEISSVEFFFAFPRWECGEVGGSGGVIFYFIFSHQCDLMQMCLSENWVDFKTMWCNLHCPIEACEFWGTGKHAKPAHSAFFIQ